MGVGGEGSILLVFDGGIRGGGGGGGEEEETSRAIIILCSILEMRPKEFRGLSNCEMSRDTSSHFRTNEKSPSFINENIRNFCSSAKIDTASHFSTIFLFLVRPSIDRPVLIGFPLFSIQFVSAISRNVQVYINRSFQFFEFLEIRYLMFGAMHYFLFNQILISRLGYDF